MAEEDGGFFVGVGHVLGPVLGGLERKGLWGFHGKIGGGGRRVRWRRWPWAWCSSSGGRSAGRFGAVGPDGVLRLTPFSLKRVVGDDDVEMFDVRGTPSVWKAYGIDSVGPGVSWA